MDGKKVLEVIDTYEQELKRRGATPLKADHNQVLDPATDNRAVCLGHCLGMIPQMREFIATDHLEKTFRWLGFIQGVLWPLGIYSIDEMKNHNRPDSS